MFGLLGGSNPVNALDTNEVAEQKTVLTCSSMIDSIQKTNLDLKNVLGDSMMKDIQLVALDDEGQHKEGESMAQTESKDKAAEDAEIAKRNHGRDANGQYKNHKNYVQLRNKVNEQEQ